MWLRWHLLGVDVQRLRSHLRIVKPFYPIATVLIAGANHQQTLSFRSLWFQSEQMDVSWLHFCKSHKFEIENIAKSPERADTENVGSTSLTTLHIVIWAAENNERTQLLKYAYAPVLMHKLDRFIKDHWNASSLKCDQHYKHCFFFLFVWGWKVDKSKEKIQ